jgi:hypothetical protein
MGGAIGGSAQGGEAGAEATGGAELGGEGGVRDHAPEPTYALEIDGPSRLRLRQGGSVEVPIEVQREGGYEEAVKVSLTGLESGLIASSEILTGAETEATLTLIAPEDAKTGGPTSVKLRVESLDGKLSGSQTLELVVAGAPGAIDVNFGENGMQRATASQVVAVAIDPEQRIWVVANTPAQGVLMRASPHGTWQGESEFEPMPQIGSAVTAAVWADDGLWLGVQDHDVGGEKRNGLVRLGLDGTPVGSFGAQGFFETTDRVDRILPRDSGGFYAFTFESELLSFLTTGEVDEGFSLFSDACVTDIGLDAKDRLYLACIYGDGTDIQLSRVLSDGALDVTFGDEGTEIADFANYLPEFRDMVPLDSTHTFVTFYDGNFKVHMLNSDGLEPLFGEMGEVLVPGVSGSHGTLRLEDGLIVFGTQLTKLNFEGALDADFADNGTLDLSALAPTWGLSGSLVTQAVTEDQELGRLVLGVRIEEGNSIGLVRIWL